MNDPASPAAVADPSSTSSSTTSSSSSSSSSSSVIAGALRVLRSAGARRLFVVVMAAGVALIAWAATDYLADGLLHPFIREKRAVGRTTWWLAALSIHVTTALVAFPTCLLLLSRRFLRASPRAHRLVGRANGVVVLFLLVPSGFVLSTTARGGFWGGAGFVVSGVITAVAMVRAIAAARRRDIAGHRRAVAHVIAQMSVAVISRALLVLAAVVTPDVDPDVVYVAALWVPVVACAFVAWLLFSAQLVGDVVVVVVPSASLASPALPAPGDHHAASRLPRVARLRPVG